MNNINHVAYPSTESVNYFFTFSVLAEHENEIESIKEEQDELILEIRSLLNDYL